MSTPDKKSPSKRATKNSSIVATLQELIQSRSSQLIIVLVVFLLAIRLYLPAVTPSPPPEAPVVLKASEVQDDMITYQKSLERQLEEILQTMEGAGRVAVMLTVDSATDTEIARNLQETSRSIEEKDGTMVRITREQTFSAQPVMARTGSNDQGVITLRENTPRINGVVVVASGANNAVVRAQLAQAVQTILSLPAHRVRVFPGK